MPMITKAFEVFDSRNQKTLKYTPFKVYWRVTETTRNSHSTYSIQNEEAQDAYNYFSSHWMDYDLTYL